MSKINGIYAAGLSVLNENLALNVEKTIKHVHPMPFSETHVSLLAPDTLGSCLEHFGVVLG